jgi:paraquat-inducible protein A
LELAALVFTASILIPILKLIGLFYLCLTANKEGRPHERTRIYRIVESIGKWSMIDVFVLAILVALVKMGAIANVQPEIGSSFFGAVVVLTILASSSFDPQILWHEKGMTKENQKESDR